MTPPLASPLPLTPCPFCGGKPADIAPFDLDRRWIIECVDCAVAVVLDASPHAAYRVATREEAIAAWNRRALPSPAPATTEQRDAVASLLADLDYIDRHRSSDMSSARFDLENVRTAVGLATEFLSAAPAPSPVAPEKCHDCGTELNEGEAKVFTVCDDCWNKKYSPQSTAFRAALRSASPSAPDERPPVTLEKTNPPNDDTVHKRTTSAHSPRSDGGVFGGLFPRSHKLWRGRPRRFLSLPRRQFWLSVRGGRGRREAASRGHHLSRG